MLVVCLDCGFKFNLRYGKVSESVCERCGSDNIDLILEEPK